MAADDGPRPRGVSNWPRSQDGGRCSARPAIRRRASLVTPRGHAGHAVRLGRHRHPRRTGLPDGRRTGRLVGAGRLRRLPQADAGLPRPAGSVGQLVRARRPVAAGRPAVPRRLQPARWFSPDSSPVPGGRRQPAAAERLASRARKAGRSVRVGHVGASDEARRSRKSLDWKSADRTGVHTAGLRRAAYRRSARFV